MSARLEAERAQVTRRLDGLYEAIADGLRTTGLKTKLEEMEAAAGRDRRQACSPCAVAGAAAS